MFLMRVHTERFIKLYTVYLYARMHCNDYGVVLLYIGMLRCNFIVNKIYARLPEKLAWLAANYVLLVCERETVTRTSHSCKCILYQ